MARVSQVAATFAFAEFSVDYLNTSTAFLGAIVLGNGINPNIIWLARYFEERRGGADLETAILASHPESAVTRLTEIWLEMERGDVFPGNLLGALWRLGRTKTYAVDNSGLEAIAARALNADTFEELQVPLGVITTDLTDGGPRLLHTGELVQALLASSALPGVFPPVRRDGHLLVDGSLLADVAVDQALEFGGAGSLVALDCMVPPPDAEPSSVADMLAVASNLQHRARLHTAVGQVEQRVPVVCMPAPGAHSVSRLDFGQTAALIDEANEAGTEFLEHLDIRGPGLYGDPYTRYTGRPNEPTPRHQPLPEG